MINRFALSCLCIELDRDEMYGVTLLYILLTLTAAVMRSTNGFNSRCLHVITGQDKKWDEGVIIMNTHKQACVLFLPDSYACTNTHTHQCKHGTNA